MRGALRMRVCFPSFLQSPTLVQGLERVELAERAKVFNLYGI